MIQNTVLAVYTSAAASTPVYLSITGAAAVSLTLLPLYLAGVAFVLRQVRR